MSKDERKPPVKTRSKGDCVRRASNGIPPPCCEIPVGSICKGGSYIPKLVILYGHPKDPAAFDDYYAIRHIPYATEHMPNVIGAENLRVVAAPGADAPPFYRVSWLAYESILICRPGSAHSPDRPCWPTLRTWRRAERRS